VTDSDEPSPWRSTQAVAIGNMQIRRFFKVEHDQLRTEISGLREQLKGGSSTNP
jgi:hypothetical protein